MQKISPPVVCRGPFKKKVQSPRTLKPGPDMGVEGVLGGRTPPQKVEKKN